MPYIIYAVLESFIKKRDKCANKSEKSSPAKTNEHVPCRYSMSTICAFYYIENNHSLYRGECMKNICISLRDHAKSFPFEMALQFHKYLYFHRLCYGN